MLSKLAAFSKTGAKVFFDPGHQIIQMSKKDLIKSFSLSDYLIVNKYEFDLIKQIAEFTDSEIIESFDKIIITY
jgi:hypothetical protein